MRFRSAAFRLGLQGSTPDQAPSSAAALQLDRPDVHPPAVTGGDRRGRCAGGSQEVRVAVGDNGVAQRAG